MNPIEEIEAALKRVIRHDPEYKMFRQKTTCLNVLGLRLPVMHAIEKQGFKFYKETSDKILDVWNQIWQTSKIHEAMYMPLFYYRRYHHRLDEKHWRMMKLWIEKIENWEHADALCALFSILLERSPKLVLPTLKKWNRSSNPWKRRASVVSTIYYASTRRTPPSQETVLSLVKPLLQDRDTYVQKGVGWQLREAYNLWPREIFKFLEKHITELPAITFSYATEKLNSREKTILKNLRRARARLVKQ